MFTQFSKLSSILVLALSHGLGCFAQLAQLAWPSSNGIAIPTNWHIHKPELELALVLGLEIGRAHV